MAHRKIKKNEKFYRCASYKIHGVNKPEATLKAYNCYNKFYLKEITEARRLYNTKLIAEVTNKTKTKWPVIKTINSIKINKSVNESKLNSTELNNFFLNAAGSQNNANI